MLASVALTAIFFVIIAVIAWFVKPSQPAFFWVLAPFGIAYVISYYLLTAQRLRDMGLTGWLTLLWIPVNMADTHFNVFMGSLAAYIVLCAVPGTQGPNRYGPDPVGGERGGGVSGDTKGQYPSYQAMEDAGEKAMLEGSGRKQGTEPSK
jgi:uncharacterized membrane protein YhaH (DUF805 family)